MARLLCPPLPPPVDLPYGVISWLDANRNPRAEEFCVCVPPDAWKDSPVESREDSGSFQAMALRIARQDALNTQYVTILLYLESQGARNITLKPYLPNPIF